MEAGNCKSGFIKCLRDITEKCGDLFLFHNTQDIVGILVEVVTFMERLCGWLLQEQLY